MDSASARAREVSGTTLVELLVTIVVIGIIATGVHLALPEVRRPAPNDPSVLIADARRKAVATATPVTVTVVIGNQPVDATAYPDGSVVTDSVAKVERLTGRMRNASR